MTITDSITHPDISTDHVDHIVHEYLYMGKLCSKWVHRLLTVDQKKQGADDLERSLQLFRPNLDH